MSPAPIFVLPSSSPWASGTTVRISSRETDGEYCVCEMSTPPNEGVALHVHDRDEEFYYILEGVYEMRVANERITAKAGAMVVIPKNVPHSFRNSGDITARAVMIFRPGGFDRLLDEIRQYRAVGSLAEEQRQACLARWGIRFLPVEP